MENVRHVMYNFSYDANKGAEKIPFISKSVPGK